MSVGSAVVPERQSTHHTPKRTALLRQVGNTASVGTHRKLLAPQCSVLLMARHGGHSEHGCCVFEGVA